MPISASRPRAHARPRDRAPSATTRRPVPGSEDRRRGSQRRATHRGPIARGTHARASGIERAARSRGCGPAAREARCRPWPRPCSPASPRRARPDRSHGPALDADRGSSRSRSRDRTPGIRTTRPGRSTASGTIARHQVGQPRRVAHRDHVELAAVVRLEGRRRSLSARTRPTATLPTRPLVVARRRSSTSRSSERSATRNAPETTCFPGSVQSLARGLDRVPGLRAPVRAVHHAHEVRRRRGEPELHRAIVERAHTDRRRIGARRRGSSS